MVKIWLLTFFCLLILASNGFSQACGRGFYQIDLNTESSVKYKLFSVTPKNADYSEPKTQDAIGQIFFPSENKTGKFWFTALKVENYLAEQFLTNYEAENYEPVYDELKSSGVSEKGSIKLVTAEAYSAPFLLRLSSKNYRTSYFIGDFLGGCEKTINISLEKD